MNNDWTQIPTQEIIDKTVASLKANGIEALIVTTGEEAKKKVFELLPEKAEVMTMSSVTLKTIGLTAEINESGKYNSLKKKLASMDRATQSLEMQKLGAAPEWTVGSVHAVTEDGKVVIASNTGSQLGAYAYAAPHVIWVVGAQKLVKDLDAAMNRIYNYTLKRESERLQKIFGVPSNVSKLLIINKEIRPGRITLIIVKEALGF
jgi:L-lactate utilization protein LutC